ncbi:hypothetical protein [Variovorax rhizosphaerae]|uniref:Uncharacterized protein n=1 Tax=Variovorax rhizosphaerae TaxID=1836200 RepID=A0ABU8WKD9_9BURK
MKQDLDVVHTLRASSLNAWAAHGDPLRTVRWQADPIVIPPDSVDLG